MDESEIEERIKMARDTGKTEAYLMQLMEKEKIPLNVFAASLFSVYVSIILENVNSKRYLRESIELLKRILKDVEEKDEQA